MGDLHHKQQKRVDCHWPSACVPIATNRASTRLIGFLDGRLQRFADLRMGEPATEWVMPRQRKSYRETITPSLSSCSTFHRAQRFSTPSGSLVQALLHSGTANASLLTCAPEPAVSERARRVPPSDERDGVSQALSGTRCRVLDPATMAAAPGSFQGWPSSGPSLFTQAHN